MYVFVVRIMLNWVVYSLATAASVIQILFPAYQEGGVSITFEEVMVLGLPPTLT